MEKIRILGNAEDLFRELSPALSTLVLLWEGTVARSRRRRRG